MRLHFKSNFELIQILFLKYCHSPFLPFDMCKANDTLRVLISSPWIPFTIPEGPLHQFLPITGNPWQLPETNWSGFVHRFKAKELKVPESFCTSHASLANYSLTQKYEVLFLCNQDKPWVNFTFQRIWHCLQIRLRLLPGFFCFPVLLTLLPSWSLLQALPSQITRLEIGILMLLKNLA